ncbi:hypothetical protein B0H10DRAFT_2346062, partial [Mycena sp. CBHHK59/15]
CCITTCIADVKPGFRTCGDPEHCNIELYQYQKGKAMFQLKNRLQRTYRGGPPPDFLPDVAISSTSRLPPSNFETDATGADLLPAHSDVEEPWEVNVAGPNLDDEEEEIELDAQDDECDGKPAQGNRTVRARFGHKRTHNEELCVYSCGTVAGRATFLVPRHPTVFAAPTSTMLRCRSTSFISSASTRRQTWTVVRTVICTFGPTSIPRMASGGLTPPPPSRLTPGLGVPINGAGNAGGAI